MRRVRLGPSFRAEVVRRAIEAELYEVKKREVRVVHYSIQDNHLHLMVEGTDRVDLGLRMKLSARSPRLVPRAFAKAALKGTHQTIGADTRSARRDLPVLRRIDAI
jgi:hypothetical protein